MKTLKKAKIRNMKTPKKSKTAQQAVKLALIGAGNRGAGIYGRYALDMPHRASFVAVVEPDTAKRNAFASDHGIPPEQCFASISEFFGTPQKDIQGVVIATLEDQRLEPLLQSMSRGWAIFVEKPFCVNAEEMIRVHDATKDYENILIVCHQMRLTPVYKTIKSLIDSGDYGEVVCIQHSENLSWHHMAHSFVRGFFKNDRLTPMLLAKSCHDLDLLVHLTGRRAVKVASFGSLNYFRKENCPPDAPEFCLDGCPHADSCPYDVLKIYFNEETDPAYIRQMGVVESKGQLLELMKSNDFGRCVFQCDNNVVDNQVVQLELEGGIHVSFTMCGHNGIERRMTKISMTNGEIEYTGMGPEIRATRFEPHMVDDITLHIKGTHGGGDRAIMDNFIDAIVTGDKGNLLTPMRDSLEGHLLVFAAEEARRQCKVVHVRDYENELRSQQAR
jgi:predicted dehydrogenase